MDETTRCSRGTDLFETYRCDRQELTFEAAAIAFEHAGSAFGPEQLHAFGALDEAGAYTNLGLLLSDQNPFEIRCATYGTAAPSSVVKREKFAGSVLQQIGEVLARLSAVDPAGNAYPTACLRAVLVNCVAHRSYAYSGPTLVNIYPDRIRFVSLGGLAGDLTVDDALQGVSTSRNPRLFAVLESLGLADGFGAGLQTVIERYEGSACGPQLEAAPCSVVAVLPNLACQPPAPAKPAPAAKAKPTPQGAGPILGAAPQGEKTGADRYDNALTQELLKHLVRKPKA